MRVYATLIEQRLQLAFQLVVVDAGEEVMHVAFENPPIGSVLLSPVVIDHVLLQPHQTIVGAFAGLTGEIVPNEALRDGFIQDVVHDRV